MNKYKIKKQELIYLKCQEKARLRTHLFCDLRNCIRRQTLRQQPRSQFKETKELRFLKAKEEFQAHYISWGVLCFLGRLWQAQDNTVPYAIRCPDRCWAEGPFQSILACDTHSSRMLAVWQQAKVSILPRTEPGNMHRPYLFSVLPTPFEVTFFLSASSVLVFFYQQEKIGQIEPVNIPDFVSCIINLNSRIRYKFKYFTQKNLQVSGTKTLLSKCRLDTKEKAII